MKIIFIQLWTTGTNVKHWAKKGENIANSISCNQFHEFSRENDKFGKLKSKEISSKWTEFFPPFLTHCMQTWDEGGWLRKELVRDTGAECLSL